MPIQEHRLVAISTPLGDEELALYKADIDEELGRPFSITVELISENDNISLDDLIGQNVTIRLETEEEEARYFNGFVSEFFQLSNTDRYAKYGAVIRPWFWLLNLSENCRIFQEKSYPDIINDVFEQLGFSDFDSKLSGSYDPQEYVVQFNESDFNFVTRIMEQEGIYYYFEHTNGKHTLVMVDDVGMLPDVGDVPFYQPEDTTNQFNIEGVSRWENFRRIRSGGVRLSDYDFETPSKNLEAVSSMPKTASLSSLERFNYPGKYKERGKGTDYTRLLMEKENVSYDTKEASSNVRTLSSGAHFNLTDHVRDDQNGQYLITKFRCTLKSDEFLSNNKSDDSQLYTCQFDAIPSDVSFRTQLSAKKPEMVGPQTAMVVGKAGEEIWTDKYGRVKVLFHWDRYAQADEESSCWMRVAQTWAGKNWGHIQVPRIGQEVLVDFLGGDPDRPIIVGSVFNGSAMPPYELPSNATRSGLKTRSSQGGGGFNEIRIEDKKDNEQIFIHAEKNQDIRVKNTHFEWIGNERHLNVGTNRFEQIKENDNLIVEGDALTKITGDVHKIYDANLIQQTSTDENYDIGGDRNQNIGGSESLKSGQDIKQEAAMNYGLKSGMNVDLKGGMNINLEAGMTINLKAGPSFISIGPSGVAISGPMIMINSGGAAGSANPGKPSKPASPDKAEEALVADNATAPGKTEVPKAKKATQEKLKLKPIQASSYSPAAQVMQQAAENGTPFCEQCEAAKKAANK
ncbi:type VI secretion system spike protein VgrG1b [Colwellia sp. KU-HH00111]|uniref:type VI secretion system Vgr family protein n=1 Tax=Colwellia sp. KU-HH00111 TaxID=3127652 RepID=UPI003106D354